MNVKRFARALLFCPLLLLLLQTTAWAQSKTVTGTVTDEKNSPVQGASVLVKGTTIGTSTDVSGKFSLNVPASASVLRISYVGYTDQEVNVVGGSTTVTVNLVPANAGSLNEVVVIGYGSVRKKDLTGSVATVGAKDFNKGQINSPEQLLQGKAAGLQITNSSGQPGGVTIVKIRGNNSIRSGNTPLYVVDGVQLDGRSARPGFNASGLGTTPDGDALTFINPNDIASIDVLKDASASAIYGSRGANGVILITTKKGSVGPARIDVAASAGFSDVMRKVDVLDAAGYKAAISKYGAPNSDSGSNVNAFDQLIRNSFTQNYSLALSGGNDNGKYRASFFVSDQDGIILKSNLKRYVASFNGQYKFLDKKLSLDYNIIAANVGEHIAPISNDAGSNGNIISQALIWNPTLVLQRSNGLYNQENPSGQVNPLAFSAAYNDITSITTILASGTAAYKITPWLEYRLLGGVNYSSGNRDAEVQGWIKGTGGADHGSGAALNNQLSSQVITHTLNFNKDVAKNFSINALVGYEYFKSNYKGKVASGTYFDYNVDQNNLVPIHYYDNLQDAKQGNYSISSFKNPTIEIQSYFARAIFNYNDRYLLTATFRADGSSKFGSGNKYAYFPSFAAAWNISNEDFMKDNTLFSNLRLRAGYGETGNQEFPADASLNYNQYGSNGSFNTIHYGNPDLKWETVKSIDGGLDFAILKGKVYGFIDYFNKKTEDPVFLQVITQPSAGASVYKNLTGASVKNSGFEISVGADIVQGKNFNWSANANVTTLKNKFVNAAFGARPYAFTGALSGQGTSNAYAEAIANNQPVDVFYLPTFKGFDKDGQGIYDTASYVGNPNPTCLLGFSTDLSYKKLTLSIGTHGAFGNKIYNNTAMSVLNIGNINGGRNMLSSIVNTTESPANRITPSTRFLENGAYFKVQSVSLRYSFGDIGKTLKNFGVYASVNNLFVITKYSGFDPEVNVDKSLNGIPSLGIDYIGYPSQRTYLLGLNFSL